MVEWTDAAIEAALSAYWGRDWSGACQDANAVHRVNAMRVALNAAVKAQGEISDYHEGIVEGVKIGRAEAFEEAARVVDDLIENDPLLLPRIAAAIRAINEAAKGETPAADEYDGQPTEAQEWRDFDPDC